MQIVLKISGIILIIVSILTIFDLAIWLINPIIEICKSIFNSTFHIHLLFKFFIRFIISIIGIILIIFTLLLGFQLISK